MQQGLTLRRASPNDYEHWAAMFDSYRLGAGLEASNPVAVRLWEWIIDPGVAVDALLAESDGTLLGFAHYRRFPRPIMADEGLFLDDLFTVQEARGRGVARALLDRLVVETNSGGFALLRWTTKPGNAAARRLYDSYATVAESVTYNVMAGNYASRVISTRTNSVEPNGPAYTPRSGGTSL